MANNFIRNLIQKPQQVWLRKAMFQVHLWLGIAVALYIFLIGLSGSILVFREEIQHWSGAAPRIPAFDPKEPGIDIATAVAKAQEAFPQARMTFFYAPRPEVPVYHAYFSEGKKAGSAYLHPLTGESLGRLQSNEKSLMYYIAQFHYFLLLDRNPGLQFNGVGGAFLLLLTLSGLFIWWPGIKQWKRGFSIDFSKSWKRINWDSHNVIGFWTLTIVSFWAISGIYFAWPREFTAAVNAVSPVSTAGKGGRITVPENKSGKQVNLKWITAKSAELMPGAYLKAIRFPANPKAPYMIYMTKNFETGFGDADYLYFNPADGALLSKTIRSDTSHWTVGDWIIWSMGPVHFGTQWGLTVKCIWFLLGLSLPFLVITGLIMYWNRYLGKRWKQIKNKAEATPRAERQQTPIQAAARIASPLERG
ncbi:PepSY-associated TM helix domain-containing protein [Bryobacter aggregatus]|uniref:PepSY-associated TM helix domain-containing protein n=1 Tax=Bryobacter aggregatus TaxID=360054 RepID=UPI00138E059F|nr:PepSY-associated TM helix domain-containing protein [Bryobacter aggregatus]